jgi:hypothetical protein
MPAEGHGTNLAHGRPEIKTGHRGLAQPVSCLHSPGGIRGDSRLGFNVTESFSLSSPRHTSSVSSLLLLYRCAGDLHRPVMLAPPSGVMVPTTFLDLASLCLWPLVLSLIGAGFDPSSGDGVGVG